MKPLLALILAFALTGCSFFPDLCFRVKAAATEDFGEGYRYYRWSDGQQCGVYRSYRGEFVARRDFYKLDDRDRYFVSEIRAQEFVEAKCPLNEDQP